MRKIFGICLVLVGIGIIAFPWVHSFILEYHVNKLISEWDSGQFSVAAAPFDISEDFSDDIWEERIPSVFDSGYVKLHMEGVLIIDKIKLHVPILRGVTKKNLDLSVCVLKYSPAMGQIGNYCIAGHNSRIYGRQFNRLKELNVGDTVKMENESGTFVYKVVNKFLTTAEDTAALEDIPEQETATLITCDYSTKPAGRLIVQCELVE